MGLNAVQSYPAERVLVAALLGRPASFHELGGRVTEEMFTEPGLRLVFRAFAELASRGERIDMATVEAEMFRLDHRLYGELNGVSFLSAMLQAVRNDSHIHEYVRLVQREWMLRGCVASLNKRGLEAQQPDVDVMKLLAGVTDDMDGLREHASGGVDVRMAAEVAREVLARSFRNQEAREKGEHIQVCTGFDELDDLTGGLYRGELAVLSGRPSMGKTAVALHMALQAARAGRNTLYFSIEMSEEEVTERILSMLSGVEAGKIRFKGTNREERALLEKAAAELAGLPLDRLLRFARHRRDPCRADDAQGSPGAGHLLHRLSEPDSYPLHTGQPQRDDRSGPGRCGAEGEADGGRAGCACRSVGADEPRQRPAPGSLSADLERPA